MAILLLVLDSYQTENFVESRTRDPALIAPRLRIPRQVHKGVYFALYRFFDAEVASRDLLERGDPRRHELGLDQRLGPEDVFIFAESVAVAVQGKVFPRQSLLGVGLESVG